MGCAKQTASVMLGLILGTTGHIALAYRESTHKIMSGAALSRSDAGEGAGIYPLLGLNFFPAHNAVANGAYEEDMNRRPLRHFYNPLNDKGIQITSLLPLSNSPDFILDPLGDRVPGTTPPDLASDSFFVAQLLYYRALTLPQASERKKAAETMFSNLGHVIHHIQDMAQPQHTRLDEHCDSLLCYVAGQYEPSDYEAHSQMAELRAFGLPQIPPVYSRLAANPAFTSPRHFWKNDLQPGKGLAEHSNANFLTRHTTFATCAQPPGYCDRLPELPNPAVKNTTLTTLNGSRYVTSSLGIPMARKSLLQPLNSEMAQDMTVHEAYFNHLVPMAMSYSVGLINFHFRGDLDASLSGSKTLQIANLSRGDMNGAFELYAEDAAGNRAPTGIAWSGTVAQGQTRDTAIAVPLIEPQPKRHVLVFKGAIGGYSTQVAGKFVNLSLTPPMPALVSPPPAGGANSGSCAAPKIIRSNGLCDYPPLQFLRIELARSPATPPNTAYSVFHHFAYLTPGRSVQVCERYTITYKRNGAKVENAGCGGPGAGPTGDLSDQRYANGGFGGSQASITYTWTYTLHDSVDPPRTVTETTTIDL